MGWTNVHPDFQNSSKNYFTSTPSDYGLGTENSRILGIKAIFAIFQIQNIFFKIMSFFVFCPDNFNFSYEKITNTK